MLTAVARSRGFASGGGSQGLRHPQVPEKHTRLGRRATHGASVAHCLRGLLGGRNPHDAAQDAAPDCLQPCAGLRSAASPSAARWVANRHGHNAGATVIRCVAVTGAAPDVATRAAPGRVQILRLPVTAVDSAATLGLSPVGGSAARAAVAADTAAAPPPATAFGGPRISCARAAASLPSDLGSGLAATAAARARRMHALAAATTAHMISTTLATSGSGARG